MSRRPNCIAEEVMLRLHRSLHPEKHEGYWEQMPRDTWPSGWEPGQVFEWNAGTIEWVAMGITNALRDVGLPLEEPANVFQAMTIVLNADPDYARKMVEDSLSDVMVFVSDPWAVKPTGEFHETPTFDTLSCFDQHPGR